MTESVLQQALTRVLTNSTCLGRTSATVTAQKASTMPKSKIRLSGTVWPTLGELCAPKQGAMGVTAHLQWSCPQIRTKQL